MFHATPGPAGLRKPTRGPGGTDLRWTLTVDEPAPDESLTGHMRKADQHADPREPPLHLRPVAPAELCDRN